MKHALVVDDSKSAQIALKTQLERHDLAVSLAESGEEALEFLEHQIVDVVFMDHTMPGMDGLEALAAIKRNPRTAMIPVMMYTSKDGEVYVGQARALGGLGVLPKEVHPQVLFDMLLKLGLVREQRVAESDAPDSPQRRATDTPEAHDGRIEPSVGIPLPALVSRILDDQAALRRELRKDRVDIAHDVANEAIEAQREVLRLELRKDRTAFAHDVANEVLDAQRAALADGDAMQPPSPNHSHTMLIALTALFAGAALIFAILSWNLMRESRPPVAATGDGRDNAQLADLRVALHTQETNAQARYLRAIDTLQWAINQNAWAGFDELPFDDARASQLRELLEHLVALGFHGRVRIESHLGEFCLVSDETGSYRLAPADLPVESCDFIGHPLDNSTFVADRQSLEFAEFMRTSPAVNHSGIAVELVAHDRAHSMNQFSFPSDLSTAGDWNWVAERNNRLEYSLISSGD